MRSPKKFLSLKFLIMLKENDYCNKDKGIDYVPCEVDELYFYKLNKISNELKRQNELKRFKDEIDFLKERKMKYCTKCKDDLPYEMFHKEEKNVGYGLKCRCKLCRKKGLLK